LRRPKCVSSRLSDDALSGQRVRLMPCWPLAEERCVGFLGNGEEGLVWLSVTLSSRPSARLLNDQHRD
jgi:hypothetical protein